ncbi:type II toxin-antitoxin system RelE/ParE family toxin [Candidatus Woesearchaeota archaeon]|nr:type II toxin-antitoxin system RelE/ParE family toxin [Candidatus Woesearchaeota archaeon]
MFDIEFSKFAEKQLYKLEKSIQQRIIATLERVRIRPHPHVKKLVGCPYFRLRAGSYRIIMDIQDKKMIIYVLEIGHRKNIYQ